MLNITADLILKQLYIQTDVRRSVGGVGRFEDDVGADVLHPAGEQLSPCMQPLQLENTQQSLKRLQSRTLTEMLQHLIGCYLRLRLH